MKACHSPPASHPSLPFPLPPCRYVPMFGDVDFDPAMAYAACSFEEQLEALSRAVRVGKVSWEWGRRFGTSATLEYYPMLALMPLICWPAPAPAPICVSRCRCGMWG
jgi:hypothetical protein